jgi:hypothetical protein
VGWLESADKANIPITIAKPIILRPLLINPAEGVDTLGLMAGLRRRLRDESYAAARGRSAQAAMVFVDEEEFPGAIRPSGTYTVEGSQVIIRLTLSKDNRQGRLQVEGSADDLAGLVARIADAILQGSKTLFPATP